MLRQSFVVVRSVTVSGRKALVEVSEKIGPTLARLSADEVGAVSFGRLGIGVGNKFLSLSKTAKSLFDEIGVVPGRGFKLDVPSADNGNSFITYVLKDQDGDVTYVGRASGLGTPREVLAARISKGHAHMRPGLVPEVVDAQGSKLAMQGAEEVFIQGYRELGAKLTNVKESLSFSRQDRILRSLNKIEAYLEELLIRGLR